MQHIVKLSSSEYGAEFFAYETPMAAWAGMERLNGKIHALADGVCRYVQYLGQHDIPEGLSLDEYMVEIGEAAWDRAQP